jgi:hypothetical protein
MSTEPKPKVVNLPGTEIYGVETVEHGVRHIEYAQLSDDAPDTQEVCGRLKEVEEALTADIVALTGMLGRLRALQLYALNGDADAIAQAEGIAEDSYSPVDWDQCGFDLEGNIEQIEELIDERREKTDVRADVPVEDVEGVIRDIVVGIGDSTGRAITVHNSIGSGGAHWITTHARITVKKLGPYVDIHVETSKTMAVRSPEAEARFKTGNAEIDALVEQVLSREGGYAIVGAIFQITKTNDAQRIDLLQKAVAA